MKELDQKALFWIAAASILFMELLIFGGWGIAVPISVTIYYILILSQNKTIRIKRNLLLLIPIIMLSLCFVFFDNVLLKFLNVIFLYGLIVLDTSEQFKVNKFEFLSIEWIMQVVPIGIIKPIKNILAPIRLIRDDGRDKYRKFFNIFWKILIGLLIGLPIVFIATILLMRSDIAFKNVIDLINDNVSFNFSAIIKRVAVFTIIYFPLCGYFYGIKNKENENYNEEKKQIKIKFDFTIIITATSFLCTIYVVYCLAKFTYLISSFMGILPAEYTFSEYARQGFFECVPLVSINLFFIMVLELFTKVDDSKKKRIITKGFIYYLIGFTSFLVISALSKMILYINAYGITLMRVYVAWILILGFIVLLLIGIKEYNNKFRLIRNIFIAFTIIFLGLNYINVDYRIAKYDADLYITGKVDTIDAFGELSNSALEPLMEVSGTEDKKTTLLLKRYENRLEEKEKWQDWNVVTYKAKKIFQNKK